MKPDPDRAHRGPGSQRPSPGDWTHAEQTRLATLCEEGASWDHIAAELGHTVRACQLKAKFIGARRDGKERVEKQLVDETDAADDILAARMATCGESFADHDLCIRPDRRVYAGTAHLTGWATVE